MHVYIHACIHAYLHTCVCISIYSMKESPHVAPTGLESAPACSYAYLGIRPQSLRSRRTIFICSNNFALFLLMLNPEPKKTKILSFPYIMPERNFADVISLALLRTLRARFTSEFLWKRIWTGKKDLSGSRLWLCKVSPVCRDKSVGEPNVDKCAFESSPPIEPHKYGSRGMGFMQ